MKNVRKKSDNRSHVPHYWLDAIRKPYEQAEVHRAELAEDHRNNDEGPEDDSRQQERSSGRTLSRQPASSGWLGGRIRN